MEVVSFEPGGDRIYYRKGVALICLLKDGADFTLRLCSSDGTPSAFLIANHPFSDGLRAEFERQMKTTSQWRQTGESQWGSSRSSQTASI